VTYDPEKDFVPDHQISAYVPLVFIVTPSAFR